MIQPEITHHYAHINGIRFHYAKAGNGARLVLLLHGFPDFWYSWHKLLGPLGEHFTVVAPDMRGYNLTDKPDWGYETDVLVQDVGGFIDERGFERAVVVGHDWGGAIAWATALAYPHRVERLVVLNCPHPLVFEAELRHNPAQLRKSWYVGFFQIPWLPETLLLHANLDWVVEQTFRGDVYDKTAFSDDDLRAYKTALAQPGAIKCGLNYYRAAARHGLRAMTRNSDGLITMPTLLIWGEGDRYLGKELIEPHARYVSDLRIHRIPRCSHWVQHERPAEVLEVMLDFLG